MNKQWVLLCLSVLEVFAKDERESRMTTIRQGQVKGYKDPEGNFFAYYGIPYATAPTGFGRFQAPLPGPVWLRPLEAVDKGIVCPQAHIDLPQMKNKVMQDDCLIANVYVPNTDETNIPVVVIVHGGAFQVGYSDLISPKPFVQDKNVIAVTFNYRLGINGFLCLGTEGAPGNAGLKDQVALLRWVKENIAKFGGNPNDVTIAGCSAGSVSVDLLMLSRSTRGLFTKVIPESGSNVGVITMQMNPLENAKKYALSLNFTDVNDVYALELFYKTAPIEQLTRDAFFNNKDSNFGFTPCIERKGKESFIDDLPMNIIKSKNYAKLPMLYGFDNMEGWLRLNFFQLWKSQMNEDFSDFLPADLDFESDDQKKQVAKIVKQFYFGDSSIENNNILEYIDYFTDVLFAYSTLKAIKLHVEAGHDQIYLYEYSFADKNSPAVPFVDVRGAPHCAQSTITFEGKTIFSLESNPTDEAINMVKNMREMWYNFIKMGQPVPENSTLPSWPPAKVDCSPHMSLGNTIELKGKLLEERTLFWDDIYRKHYRPPVPPPTPPAKHTEL
ncbi:hypothetical protein K1T71_003406 [Dendrolimus kikuchii]|uniref:Uncharacterized protein n=1 Tax=Dendrolimus kikuchii TaxID=765133 RepID=A0ACC1DCD8_9NEOP|nr:hypothetical protein K1T71_003406 [Dendrolimus kikuchii]